MIKVLSSTLDHLAFFGGPFSFLGFFPDRAGILIVGELAFSLCVELVVFVVAMECNAVVNVWTRLGG